MKFVNGNQLLYMVRNELEWLGYKCVQNAEESDFLVRLTYSNEHRRVDVAATTTNTAYSDSRSATGLGFAQSYGTARKYGSYCPTLKVTAFDTHANEEIWSGSALAETPNPEIRLSANDLLPMLVRFHFPMAAHAAETVDSREGIFGCDFSIVTPNGNDYFPVITGLLHGSPASAKLRVYDVITEINGNATGNRPYSEIRAAFDKRPGEEVSLTLNRSGKTLKTTIVAAEEAKIRWLDLYVGDDRTGLTKLVPLKSTRTQSPNLSREDLLNFLP